MRQQGRMAATAGGLAIAAMTATAAQHTTAPAADAAVVAEATAILSAWDGRGWFNGSVLVARKDTVVFNRSYGVAHPAYGIRTTPDTQFIAAGLGPMITAAIALRLQEQGKLSLTVPVGTYMTDWPAPVRDLTLHQLLVGRTGIRDVSQIPDFTRAVAVPRSVDELVGMILKAPVATPPQGRSINSSVPLAAAVLMKVSGKTFDALLQSEIAAPLGVTSLRQDGTSVVTPGRSVGFLRTGRGPVLSAPFDVTNALAVSDILATPDAVFRVVRGLATGRLLTPASLATMTTNYQPAPAPTGAGVTPAAPPGLGYGWSLQAGPPAYWAISGGSGGFSTNVSYTPSTEETIVVLSNNPSGEGSAVAGALRNVLAGKPGYRPAVVTPRPARGADLKAIEGTWEVGGVVVLVDGKRVPQRVTVRVDGARIFVSSAQGAPEVEWQSDGAGSFYNPQIDQRIDVASAPDKPHQYLLYGRAADLRRPAA